MAVVVHKRIAINKWKDSESALWAVIDYNMRQGEVSDGSGYPWNDETVSELNIDLGAK